MHIAYVCPRYPAGDSANGVSTYTDEMAKELIRRGHRVTVLCLQTPPGKKAGGQEEVCGVRVRWVRPGGVCPPVVRSVRYRVMDVLAPGYLPYRDMAVGLRRAVRDAHAEHRIDVMECPEWAGLAWWLLPVGIPLVVRLHCPSSVSSPVNGVPWSRKVRTMERLERRCLKHAPALTAPSRSVVVKTEEILNLKLPQTCLIPYPVDVGPSEPEQVSVRDARSILFVGRTDLVKGFDVMILAFRLIAARYRDVRLSVVGAEYPLLFEGKRRTTAKGFIDRVLTDREIKSRVELVGRLSHGEVQRVRHQHAITVMPSRFESFSIALVEAMASGCAVVASNVGGPTEIVQDARNGLLFESGNPRDLAYRICELLDDPVLASRLGEQARRDVRQRYSPALIGRQTVDYYREVIRAHSAERTE